MRLSHLAVSTALVSVGVLQGTTQADLLYKWDFNAGNGANTGTGAGGTLVANAGITNGPTGYAAGTFLSAGVSGNAGDYAFGAPNAYDGYYPGNNYSPISNAAGISNLDMSGVTQFTITMWINRGGSRNVDVLNIGNTTTPGSTSNPGISIGVDGNWANGVRLGVKGNVGYTGDLWGPGYDTDWVFVAFVYDGTDTYNVYEDPAMNALYGQDRNVAILTGTTGTSATVATGMNMHGGDYWTPVGAIGLDPTATVFLANDGSNTSGMTNGFDGALDDIRIYNSLLTVSEIETIRTDALPEPASLSLIGLAALATRRRRTRH
ncbi:MAG TPA: hypothetical protein VK968_00815 [Roseimicrobium sp.]|nr:hypothetical protein [Roseimicrobium sp.]